MLLLLPSAALAGQTFDVPGDLPTLSAALSAAQPGDTVHLGTGTYLLPVGRSIEVPIVGEGVDTVLVVSSVGDHIVDAGAGRVRLQGLTLDGQGHRAVNCEHATVELINITLRNGGLDADPGEGGGLARFEDCTVLLRGARLENTTIDGPGGLVRFIDSTVAILDSEFFGGVGSQGGALHLNGGTLQLHGSSIAGNRADEDGGGGLAIRDAVMVGSHNSWTSNVTASDRGGGIRTFNTELHSVASSFQSNTAAQGAGALFSRGGTLNVEGGGFYSNTSDAAGGLSCRDSTSCFVYDSVFIGNAGSNGGAMQFDNPAVGRFSRNRFCENVVQGTFLSGNGGAVYISGGEGVEGSNNLYVSNRADDGGGLYAQGGSFEHATMVGNEANTGAAATAFIGGLSLSNSVLVQNVSGEALRNWAFSTPDVRSNLFFENPEGNASFSLDSSNREGVDPLLAAPSSTSCQAASFMPLAGSPLIDAASGPADQDGSPADIGAFGGPGFDPIDADGDGVFASQDCDDQDASIGWPVVLFTDGDGDGYGGDYPSGVGCPSPSLVVVSGDCDDTDAAISPVAIDVANGVDDDCDLLIDEGESQWYRDGDGDGFGDPNDVVLAVVSPAGFVGNADDCDDADPAVLDTRDWFVDADGDGFGAGPVLQACEMEIGWSATNTDCDDQRADVSPNGVEICDGSTDEDCDGLIDDADPSVSDAHVFYTDEDGDGFPGSLALACELVPGSAVEATDCDDGDALISPAAVEVCDPFDVDEDCSGAADDDDPAVMGTVLRFADRDDDGFGDALLPTESCDSVGVLDATDCDDLDPMVFPGADEIPDDGIDQSCDGLDAEWLYSNGAACGCASPGGSPFGGMLMVALMGIRRRR